MGAPQTWQVDGRTGTLLAWSAAPGPDREHHKTDRTDTIKKAPLCRPQRYADRQRSPVV
jgi:hypothetical protein